MPYRAWTPQQAAPLLQTARARHVHVDMRFISYIGQACSLLLRGRDASVAKVEQQGGADARADRVQVLQTIFEDALRSSATTAAWSGMDVYIVTPMFVMVGL
jgi:hypothetical protein